MPSIKKKPQAVKGTTRVSFGDRQLIKKLWVADKNSRASKTRRTRELSQEDRAKLAATPHRRAIDAFQKWSKKARAAADTVLFEFADTDDRIDVSAMCTPTFSTLATRRERMHECAQMLESLRVLLPSQKRAAAVALVDAGVELLRDEADTDVPLLTGRKHSRAFNYRKRRAQREALFCGLPARKRARHGVEAAPTDDNIRQQQQIAEDDAVAAHYRVRNLCEPLPRSDYQTFDPSVFYVCYTCNEPVRSTEMVVEANGAFDAIFYHRRCFKTRGH